MGTETNYRTLRDAQIERLTQLGRSLDDQQWDTPSLCGGWRVRDIFGHMTMGATFPVAKVGALVATRYRGNIHRGSSAESVRLAESVDRAELMNRYEAAGRHLRGIARLLPPKVAYIDSIVHELDMRHPLGFHTEDRTPEEITRILDLCLEVSTPLFPLGKWAKGLSLTATDVGDTGWSRIIDGAPSVTGEWEHLVLALAGRAHGLANVTGDGVAVLSARTGTPVPAVDPLSASRS